MLLLEEGSDEGLDRKIRVTSHMGPRICHTYRRTEGKIKSSGYNFAVWFYGFVCISISSHAVWVMICVKQKILCATIIWRC